MGDIDIREDTTRTVTLTPSEVWTTPSAAIVDPDGSTLSVSLTPTQDATSTTIASSPTNAFTFAFADNGGTVGSHYLVTHDGVAHVVRVVEKSAANVLTVEPALPETPTAGDAVAGLDITCAIPVGATTDRGHDYVLTITDTADASRELRQVYHVVRRLFLDGISAFEIRKVVDAQWPSATLSWWALESIADEVQQELRQELLSSGRYADIYLSGSLFLPVARDMATRILATRYGLLPPGDDSRGEFISDINREINRKLGRVMLSFAAKDSDDDNASDADKPGVLAIRTSL